MSKRPSIDLMALTSEQAAPMPEAVQRVTQAADAGEAVAQIADAARRASGRKIWKPWPSKCRRHFASGSSSVPSMPTSS